VEKLTLIEARAWEGRAENRGASILLRGQGETKAGEGFRGRGKRGGEKRVRKTRSAVHGPLKRWKNKSGETNRRKPEKKGHERGKRPRLEEVVAFF